MISKRVLFIAGMLIVAMSTWATADVKPDYFAVRAIDMQSLGAIDLGVEAIIHSYLPTPTGAVATTTFADANAFLTTGYFIDTPLWTGGGIYSSKAAADPLLKSLGILSGDDYNNYNGADYMMGNSVVAARYPSGSINAGDTLIKYTWAGDSNFSGTVDIDDYGLIDVANQVNYDSNPSNDVPINWLNGDYNYSGSIDVDDYSIIDYVNQVTGGAPFTGAAAASAVPEPATFVMLALVALFGMAYRLRRS
jgi:hypothetical protein